MASIALDGPPVTIQQYDPIAREYRTVTVPASPMPRARTRRRARRPATARMPLVSSDAPIPAWWRDTAFADMGPLADMRTMRRTDQTIRPAHRQAEIYPTAR